MNPDQVLDLIVLTDHNDPSATILQVVGDVDAYTAPLLRDAVKVTALHAGERVTIDLSDVQYFSTAGAVVLLDAHHDFGGQLVVTRATSPVRRLLDLLGIGWLCTSEPASNRDVADHHAFSRRPRVNSIPRPAVSRRPGRPGPHSPGNPRHRS